MLVHFVIIIQFICVSRIFLVLDRQTNPKGNDIFITQHCGGGHHFFRYENHLKLKHLIFLFNFFIQVASVVGRAELLSALFYLSSILLWISSKKNFLPTVETSSQHGSSKSSSLSTHLQTFFLKHWQKLAAVSLALIGFLCKEQSILALPYLVFFELIDFRLTGVKNNKTSKVVNHNLHYHHNHNLRSSSKSSNNYSPLPPPLCFRRHKSGSLPHFLSAFRSAFSSLSLSSVFSSTSFGALFLLGSSFLFAIYLRFSIIQFTFPTFSR